MSAAPNPPHSPLSEYYPDPNSRQAFLNDLFDRSAAYYERIDSITAFGSGPWYRRRTLLAAGLKPGMQLLDVACGTGLVTIPAQRIVGSNGLAVGLDPSTGMLGQARRSGCGSLIRGTGDKLPFTSSSFDFISMGYALRHIADLTVTFAEYHRVLKPGGIVLILELAPPRSPLLRAAARIYIREIVGRVFQLFSGDPALKKTLQYWWDSSEQCVPSATILGSLDQCGFTACQMQERFNGLLREFVAVRE